MATGHARAVPRGRRHYAGPVDYFVYSQAAGDAADHEVGDSLNEEHWSYMDRFADGMTARGPTHAADRETWTGSLHIVDLPDDGAARAFVEHEPYNRAGLFEGHLVRRFDNLFGRDMWEFPPEPEGPRFLVIAHHRTEPDSNRPALPWARPDALPVEQLIFHGALLLPEDPAPSGVAFAIQAPTRAGVEALLAAGSAGLDSVDVAIHSWEFGGRR